jgi:hypothetical protein
MARHENQSVTGGDAERPFPEHTGGAGSSIIGSDYNGLAVVTKVASRSGTSYAWVDNEPYTGAEVGWVSTFVDGLRKHLARELGRRDVARAARPLMSLTWVIYILALLTRGCTDEIVT